MPFGSHTGSAEIIPFPVRFRSPTGAFDASSSVGETKPKEIYDAAFASSWYHQEAVEDAKKGPHS